MSLTNNQTEGYSGFLAQFDPNGATRWVKQTGDGGGDVQALALDATGNLCVSGTFGGSNPVTFGPGAVLTAQNSDGFVAKYSAQGELRWVRQYGGAAYDYGAGVATDATGAVFVCGQFGDTRTGLGTASATFGRFQLTTTSASSPPGGLGFPDGFVAKYDAQGTCQWVQAIRGGEEEAVRSVAVNQRGEVYVGGAAYSGVLFGANTSLPGTAYGYQGFVAKYDGAGALRWLQSYGSSGRYSLAAGSFRSGLGLATDGVGRVYVCGAFQGDAYFGGIYASGSVGSVEYPFLAALDDQELPLAARPAAATTAALHVYPNPSAGPVRVAWPAGTQPVRLEVLDALGRPVRTLALPPAATEHPLDLTGLPPGVYLLRLQSTTGSLAQKLVLN